MEEMMPVKGEVRVARAEDLWGLTQQGWRLLRILPESEIDQGYEQVPTDQGRNGGGYPQHVQLQRSYVIQVSRYLLWREEGCLLAELQAEIGVLKNEVRAVRGERDEQAKAADALQALGQKLKMDGESAQRDYLAAQERFQKERERANRMEGDLAKVANAIGALQMKSILEGEKG